MHTIPYEILNMRPEEPPRKIEVHATQDELIRLEKEGYLVREQMFSGEVLEELRAGMDRVEAMDYSPEKPTKHKDFGGLTVHHLMDKDEAFLKLITCDTLISVARAMLGPQIQMNAAGRITYPGLDNQRTIWHHHLRYIPKPLPPWFMRPQCMNVLIYLDDVTDENGPLCLVPGSHLLIQEEPSADYYGDLPGQVLLRPKAGTAVFMHSLTWHIAKPTTPDGTKRRLLNLNFFPTWLKRTLNENRPENSLIEKLLQDADQETLELLGKAGYM